MIKVSRETVVKMGLVVPESVPKLNVMTMLQRPFYPVVIYKYLADY